MILNFIGPVLFSSENISLGLVYEQGPTQHFCSFCPYSTHRSSHMKRHLMTHTGERPFKCTVCDYRCNQKENLKKHMFKHLNQT